MTTPKSLPVRPSLESIRKQAKRLARDTAAGNEEAVARAQSGVADIGLPLSQRDAQLVLAREYGFAGWHDLREEVLKRSGSGLEWASVQARRAIHDNDVAHLKRLTAEYPALLSWRDDLGDTLLDASTSFANDNTDPIREDMYNRPGCAGVLIDAGAVVERSVWERVIRTRAAGMLQLLWDKGVLPRTLPLLAALGDLDGVRTCLDEPGAMRVAHGSLDDRSVVNEAFLCACRFDHDAVASVLLDRCIALDNDLGQRIERWQGRSAFVEFLCGQEMETASPEVNAAATSPWRAFILVQLTRAMDADDLSAFTRWFRTEPYLLGDSYVELQVQLLDRAAWTDRAAFMTHLLDLDPAVLHRPTPPPSRALVSALEYGNAHLMSLLTRVWPVPDDLPHAAAVGDIARVRRWFDDAGRPALGNPHDHFPANSPRTRADLGWGTSNVQQILDVALAWACVNRQFEIAAFLLEHGADINTRWGTHEPASILHECAVNHNVAAARFLIAHGIDMTIRDHRYNATAEGWARHAAHDEEMADLLAAGRGE
ncbi:ankyrin repeat domain-containing protein [Actinopolymorpha sp. B9G3]|uniref:ankyrin repeat domain-containing protein n=1 Tax=Actinopolymorpha sp. B9G3 TaxID=3158970 RepID=UPI0032D9322B